MSWLSMLGAVCALVGALLVVVGRVGAGAVGQHVAYGGGMSETGPALRAGRANRFQRVAARSAVVGILLVIVGLLLMVFG